MAINGSRSTFPCQIDDFGAAFVNNICTKITAERWNFIEDAAYLLERQSLGVLQSGSAAAAYTHTPSGATRPSILFKAYTATLTGAAASIQTFQLSGFTAAEKALFAGTPLATGNTIHVQIRKLPGVAGERAYSASVKGPIGDPTGDSGFWVQGSSIRHGNGDFDIQPGIYCISVMITSY
jgi:hypothetical protein